MLKIDFDVNWLQNFFLGRTSLLFAILYIFLIIVLFQTSGCSLVTGSDDPDFTYEYQFDDRPNDWSTLFSNYWVGREDDFELESGYRPLPEPLDTDKTGYYLSGKNISDDLNMFWKHRIDDLEPETSYRVEFDVTFATDAPSGCVGVGGPPGEGVTVHTSLSNIEPARVVDDSSEMEFYRLNLAERYDGEAHSWYRATEIGDVANSRECEEGREYELKNVMGVQQSTTTDASGSFWLLVGTRSGFEATTSLYYTEVKVRLWED